jgi:hypothetical protein
LWKRSAHTLVGANTNPDPDPNPSPSSNPNPNPDLYTGCSAERLRLAHFVRQRSIQAQFQWHQDHDENRDHYPFTTSMITVVILLSGHGTGMQVWGFQVFPYSSAGVAAAFPGAATHRSVCHGAGVEEVVKLALFFE